MLDFLKVLPISDVDSQGYQEAYNRERTSYVAKNPKHLFNSLWSSGDPTHILMRNRRQQNVEIE